MVNNGCDPALAQNAVAEGADIVSFGRPYIANPRPGRAPAARRPAQRRPRHLLRRRRRPCRVRIPGADVPESEVPVRFCIPSENQAGAADSALAHGNDPTT